jgi:pimeloyl-ACP methyl ester carboxylesterase
LGWRPGKADAIVEATTLHAFRVAIAVDLQSTSRQAALRQIQESLMATSIQHHRIDANGVALHYAVAGQGRPLVLIHGFPQTWFQWRSIIERLGDEFRIIAPDLRGIGTAPGPATGYDKHTLADDIHAIVAAECGQAPIIVCGHDMGSFIAFAYAAKYRAAVDGLMLVDAPPPGTSLWAAGSASPRAWHIAFHAQIDVALMLVSGRERQYISQFIGSRIYDRAAISEDDIDVYAAAYSAPGALRAAFEMYRALLHEDPGLNRKALAAGKLEMPVMLIGGSMTIPRSGLEAAVAEIAENGRAKVIERCGHWISEERPDELAACIRELASLTTSQSCELPD